MTSETDFLTTRAALDRAARAAHLVVACDFDGTLSPFVSDPESSRLAPGAREALDALAALPATTVLLVSGRDRTTLSRISEIPTESAATGIHLVGQHGSELEGKPAALTEVEAALLAEITSQLEAIALPHEGAFVEYKPSSAVLHVRSLPRAEDQERLLSLALEGPAAREGVFATEGKSVLELAVREASKGAALQVFRERTGAESVVFFGDDVTDEKGFAVLGPDHGGSALDVGIKVGDGPTVAGYRVASIDEVVVSLRHLAAVRGGSKPA